LYNLRVDAIALLIIIDKSPAKIHANSFIAPAKKAATDVRTSDGLVFVSLQSRTGGCSVRKLDPYS
jgi:hypothetical protein